MGVRVIEQPRNAAESWLVETVRRQAQAAGIGMPEVGIFDAPDMNAFATGRAPQQRAGRRQHRPAARHVATRSRSRARPRNQPRRERRHGDADPDPGRREHLRDLPVARHRLHRRPRRVQDRARPRSGVPDHGDRRAARARHSREHDRDVVLAAARIPCRRGRRASWPAARR